MITVKSIILLKFKRIIKKNIRPTKIISGSEFKKKINYFC